MRAAILEDDPAVASELARTLASAGYSFFSFDAGQQLIKFLRAETVDLLLLDWNVPGTSGIDVVRWVKQSSETPPPILMITVRSTEEDVLAAFQAGVDDYVTKPIQPAVLLARMEAVLRRTAHEPLRTTVEQFGVYELDLGLNEIRAFGETVTVTPKEFSLALLLFRNINRSLSRSYILENVWGRNPDLQTRTVDTHVSKVRAKLKLRAEHGFRLVPLYGYGYRLERTS